MENKPQHKISFTALGLIFGTAIGTVVTAAIGRPFFWAGVGAGLGLVIGAAIDSMKKRC